MDTTAPVNIDALEERLSAQREKPHRIDLEAIAARSPIPMGDGYRFSDEFDLRVPLRLNYADETREVYVDRLGNEHNGLYDLSLASPMQFKSRPIILSNNPYMAGSLAVVREPAWESKQRIVYRIDAIREDGRENVFEMQVDPLLRDDGSGWHDFTLNLAKYAGETVQFEFVIEQEMDEMPLLGPLWAVPSLFDRKPEGEQRRPNILLISLDTLRMDRLSCYGYDRPTSPNLDQLADEGLLFENCITPSSWTFPTHASIMTGLHPTVHGLNTYSGVTLPLEEFTLGELAKKAGYRVGACLSNGWISSQWGFSRGFEEYIEYLRMTPMDLQIEKSLEFLDRVNGTPFFFFFHTNEIHSPYAPPEEFLEQFTDPAYEGPVDREFNSRPAEFVRSLNDADRKQASDLYDAGIAYTDYLLGQFFAELKTRELWEDTMVIVFSDHGEELWDRESWGHGVTLYDELIRSPLIIKLPGKQARAGRIDALVDSRDLYPTVAEMLGFPVPQGREYYSLSPIFLNETTAFPREHVISTVGLREDPWHFIPPQPQRLSIRTRYAKLIVNGEEYPSEYYRLDSDPAEHVNVYESGLAEVLALESTLQAALQDYERQRATLGTQETISMDEEMTETLQALGYL